MKNRTIILANGSFPKSSKVLDILKAAEQIICCDGAVNKLVNFGLEPQIIIGDLDSVNPAHKEKYADRLIHILEQDTNDLTKAINWCLKQSIKEVLILGATGEREDHTIANIALLSKYISEIKVSILSDHGLFLPISETATIESFPGQQVSIFSQSPEVEISSKGLKYPLQELKLRNWWMGTLNEALEKKFTIEIENKSQVIVYLVSKEK